MKVKLLSCPEEDCKSHNLQLKHYPAISENNELIDKEIYFLICLDCGYECEIHGTINEFLEYYNKSYREEIEIKIIEMNAEDWIC